MISSTSPQVHVSAPQIERIRHTLKRRTLEVEHVLRLTPAMLRITFRGDDLSDFVSLAPDDHIKVFVPGSSGELERRDYTPRRHDAAAGTLLIDFALHEAGPATAWALAAQVGDRLEIAGPRGSAVIGPDVRNWVLIGDETALPAMGRRIEEAGAGARIVSLGAITGPEERQAFATRADLTALWAYRPLSAANDPGPLLAALLPLAIAPDTFVWIAAEAAVTRAVRTHFLEDRGHSLGWMKASGYWVMGEADAHEKFA